MGAYRNEVLDMLKKLFSEHRVMVIPRIEKRIADSLATVVKESILWLGFKRPSTYWG